MDIFHTLKNIAEIIYSSLSAEEVRRVNLQKFTSIIKALFSSLFFLTVMAFVPSSY